MKKKRLTVLMSILMAASVSTGAAAVMTACGGDEVTYVKLTQEQQGEYYGEADGKTCVVELSENTFKITVDGETRSAIFTTLDGTNLQVIFADTAESIVATLSGDTLSFTYKGAEYSLRKKVSYTVTFDTKGGSKVDPVSVISGNTISKPAANPTKSGYAFVGWYADSEYKTAFDFENTPITANITLYARFETAIEGREDFTVSFDLGYEGAPEISSMNTANGILYDLPVPQREGKKFIGWWMSDYQSRDKLTAQYTNQVFNANTILFAVWEDEGLSVSVDANGVSWKSAGVNVEYTVTITAPDGNEETQKVSATKYAYDFASKAAGDYEISVTASGKTSTVYYKNKAVARVSKFTVENSVLTFKPVANAASYKITVKCGDKAHSHENIDLGEATSYDFSACAMKEGGIEFIVTAIAAEGYADSVSDTFFYERTLEAPTGLAVDEAKGLVTWTAVKNATGYIVEITQGTDVKTENVGTETSYSIKALVGKMKIRVYATADGYNPSSSEIEYEKSTLAVPEGLKISGKTLSWEAVAGATSYQVKVGSRELDPVEGTTLTLTDDQLTGGNLKIYVRALAAEAEFNSPYSDPLVLAEGLGSVSYVNGYITFNAVASATKYGVQINEEEEIFFESGESKIKVDLVAEGKNTIRVRYYKADETTSDWAATTVTAYAITFDSNGGEELPVKYYAKGDTIVPPEAANKGYTFGGWYTAKENGKLYTGGACDGASATYYAYWISNEYSVTLEVGDGGTMDESLANMKVAYGEKFKLPVPESNNSLKVFGGWFTEPNNVGIQYTDPEGTGRFKWNDATEVRLYAGWIDVFKYNEIDNGAAYSVSKGDGIGYVTKIKVPVEYNGKPITTIEGSCFASCAKLVTVEIPNTIRLVSLGDSGGSGAGSAFQGCTSLQEVKVYPVEGNREIKYWDVDGILLYENEFNGIELKFVPAAKELINYRIPDEVTTLPINVFRSSKLESVIIPSTVTKIDTGAFASNSKLTSVVFLEPEEGKTAEPLQLGSGVFKSCSVLTEITFPARLQTFSTDIFDSCNELKEINIVTDPDAAGEFASIDGIVFNKDKTMLVYCPRGREGEYTIPTGVNTIGERAFYYCKKLTKVTIPGFVTMIEREAFLSASGITEIDFQGNDVADPNLEIGEKAFYNCSGLSELKLPGNLQKLGKYAFGGNSALIEVTLECNREEVDYAGGAFATETSKYTNGGTCYVQNLIIGKDVPALEINSVFGANTVHLANITVDPLNPYYDSDQGILYNKGKTQILYYPIAREGNFTIPETVTEIGAAVFKDKLGITSITIHKGITKIGDEAFSGCTNLTKLIFEDGRDVSDLKKTGLSIGNNAFYETKIEEAILPEGTVFIGDLAFSKCSALVNVYIPSTLETIEIADVQKVDSNYYPQRPAGLQFRVFDSSYQLTSIEVAEANKNYADVQGVLCKKEEGKVTEVYFAPRHVARDNGVIDLPKTLTKIWDTAFYFNESVREIKFSEGIEGDLEFGIDVFYYCKALERVELPKGLKKIGDGVFRASESLVEVVIPNTVTEMGLKLFSGCKSLKTIRFEEGGTEPLVLVDPSDNNGTFSGSSIEEIVFPERLTKIGKSAFYDLKTLKSVVLPKSLENIGQSAFYQCTNLMDVTFTEGGTSDLIIGASAFYQTSITSLVFPSNLVEIGQSAFNGNKALTSLSIPAATKTIGGSCFTGCTSLQTVTFGGWSKLETLGSSAFNNCKALKSVNFDALTELKEIPSSAFGTTLIESVTISPSVTKIGASAFSGCTALKNVTFLTNEDGKAALTSVGNMAFKGIAAEEITFPESDSAITLGATLFEGCKNLKTVNLSSSIADIGSAFTKCSSITTITVAEGSANLKNHDTQPLLLNAQGTAIRYGYAALPTDAAGTYVIPEGFTEIGESAFMGQNGIKKIVIPSTVKLIGKKAFAGCLGLEEVEFANGSSLTDMGMEVFYSCASLKKIALPSSLTELPEKTFEGCVSLKDIDLGGATIIGKSAFLFCSSLEELDVSGVTEIRDNAFESCTSLKTLDFKDVSKVGTYLFQYCESLKTVKFGSALKALSNSMFKNSGIESIDLTGITSVGSYVFQDCTELKTVKIGPDLNTLGSTMFSGCISLESIDLTGITKVNGSAFSKCTNLKSIILDSSLQTLASSLFSGCTALTEIELPNVTTVSSSAFGSCENLKKVTFGAAAVTIDSSAFKGCTNLEMVDFTDVIKVNTSAFENCTSLVEIELPDATEVGNSAFKGCTALTTVKIPKATTIGTNAFENCALLKTVTAGKLTSVKTKAFYKCSALDTIDISTVTTLGNTVFMDCVSLESVKLNPAIKNVQYDLFAGCESLKTIDLSNVTTIGTRAFNGCISLQSVTLNPALTAIDSTTFKNCKKLGSIDLSNITSLNTSAFEGCESLTTVDLPKLTTLKGGSVFKSCTNLTSVTFGASLLNIQSSTFEYCYALNSVVLPANLKTISGSAFRYTGLQGEFIVPEGVTEIGANAFQCATEVTSFRLPSTLTKIGDNAFAGCDSLTSFDAVDCQNFSSDENGLLYDAEGNILCYPLCAVKDGKIVIPDGKNVWGYAFNSVYDGAKTLVLPEGLTEINNYAFINLRSSIEEIVLPSTVTSIGSSAFKGMTSLKKINIPEGVTVINRYTFENCTNLTEVSLPSTLTMIDISAFSGCTNLKSISFPASLQSIGTYAFKNCGFTALVIPKTLTSIGQGAFNGCENLSLLEFEEGGTEELVLYRTSSTQKPEYGAFGLTKSLKTVTLPSRAKNLGGNTFAGSGLTTVAIPEGVETIGVSVFEGCESLKNVTLPSTLTSIGNSAFNGCISLANIAFPNTLTSIGSSAFAGCGLLQSITLPAGIQSVGNYAFKDCAKLASIDLGGATSLGDKLFTGTAITTVTLPATLQKIGDTFYESPLTEITIPKSVTEIGNRAFMGSKLLAKVVFEEGGEEPLKIKDGDKSANKTEIEAGYVSYGAFAHCPSLTTITLPGRFVLSGEYAFAQCTSLETAVFADGVEGIDEGMFFGCTSLKNVRLPDTLTKLDFWAFENLTSIENIEIPASMYELQGAVFGGWTENQTITIVAKRFFVTNWSFYWGKNCKAKIVIKIVD